jgi:hypothetical protein
LLKVWVTVRAKDDRSNTDKHQKFGLLSAFVYFSKLLVAWPAPLSRNGGGRRTGPGGRGPAVGGRLAVSGVLA